MVNRRPGTIREKGGQEFIQERQAPQSKGGEVMKRPKKKAPPTRTAQLITRQRSSTGQAQGQANPMRLFYDLLHPEGESYAEFIDRRIRQLPDIPKGETGTFSEVYRSPGSIMSPGRASLKLSRKERP
jgi:hypothetical protein